MYTAGDAIEDYTEGSVYAREILDSEGNVICYVVEPKDSTYVDALLSHLNRG